MVRKTFSEKAHIHTIKKNEFTQVFSITLGFYPRSAETSSFFCVNSCHPKFEFTQPAGKMTV